MNHKSLISTLFLIQTIFAGSVHAQQLAFPEAQGWGRFALGARGVSNPTVYHVTNLNDSGSGSLRDAVSQSGRVVVFDVSGVINISSRIGFAPNIYVAGQTAPGEGITVYGDGVTFSGSDNIICRYLRVRMGHGGSSGKDCAGVAHGTNMIFDHCSFSWGLDETFSINSDGKGDIGTITLQNSIIGQGLMTHSAGGLMQADRITLYRNFYCDNSTRNNKVKGINQFANNIVYNWKNGAYIMGGDSEGKSYVNIESNLFINGPAGGGAAFTGANADFHCYGNDNWQDSNKDGIFDPFTITDYSASTRESKPYDYPKLPLYKGNELLTNLLPTVGASLPYRDQADCYMVDEAMTYGSEGALITYETSLPIGAPNTWTWWKGEKATDTDGDGMPDWWENANGTNASKNDACQLAANGYLNIENYINSITADNRQFYLREPITLSLKSATTSTLTLGWRDYTYAEQGFCIELKQDGNWQEVARTEANATSYTLRQLTPGTAYDIRVRAFATVDGTEQYSSYATQTGLYTRPLEGNMIDIDNFVPQNTLGNEQTEVNTTTTDWLEGNTFLHGNSILLNTDDTRTLSITEDIEPSAVVVNGRGQLTLTGSRINGDSTSLNKGNSGTLILNSKHGYKGATVLHGGELKFKYIANAGAVSSIGASSAFAQNWVFDGGTFCYTGTSASSNRPARISQPSTLSIEKSSTTLTLSGVFEGDGSLTIAGKGTLSLADISFIGYKGATRLAGGKVYLSDTENACKALGKSGKQIVMAGGTLQFASRNEDYQELSFPIEVEDETVSTLIMPTHCYFKSPITGNGTLKFDINYLRAYLRPDLSNFTGKIIGNGTNTSGASLFFHETQWNAPNVRFELKGNAYMAAWTTNAVNVIGGLSGDAGTYLVGSSKQSNGWKCSWEVGSANSDETFHGIINNLPAGLNSGHSGTVSIKKVGTGLWRLTGRNEHSGTTTVSAGTLVVNGSHVGTGAVSVAKGATLKGKGTLAGKVTAASGATICSGDTLVNKSVFKLDGGLALQKGSTLVVPINEVSTDGQTSITYNTVRVTGSLSIATGATLCIDLSKAPNHVFQDGDVIPVFSSTSLITSKSGMFTGFSPEVPAEGLHWDTSTLLQDGKLRVARDEQVGIKNVYTDGAINEDGNTSDAGHINAYDLSGRKITRSNTLKSGIYIRNGKKVRK